MTGEAERGKLAAHSCGERVPMRLAPTGVRPLPDLRARGRWDPMRQIGVLASRPLWRAPIAVRARHGRTFAGREGSRSLARRKTAGG